MSQIVCTQCGAELRPETALYVGDEAVCPSCAETDTTVCSYCGERIWREHDAGDSDTPLCESCYDSHYPMDIEPEQHLKMLRARPLETTFYRQVQASRVLYGPQLEWNFTVLDLQEALSEPLQYYAERDTSYIKDRVETCVMAQQKRLSID